MSMTSSPASRERSWQMAGTLSGGEQQMLAVGRAMMARPKLMMMDEPSLGLAPLVVRDIFHIIRQLSAEGITILLIEQNANAALKCASYGFVLETGVITMEGKGLELLEDPRVRDAYLGRSQAPQVSAEASGKTGRLFFARFRPPPSFCLNFTRSSRDLC